MVTNKFNPEKRDEYIRTAMAWSMKKIAGDEEEALLLKEKLIRMEKELSMTAVEIINSIDIDDVVSGRHPVG